MPDARKLDRTAYGSLREARIAYEDRQRQEQLALDDPRSPILPCQTELRIASASRSGVRVERWM
ncbi:hypothetical protein [Streptomyces deserti]